MHTYIPWAHVLPGWRDAGNHLLTVARKGPLQRSFKSVCFVVEADVSGLRVPCATFPIRPSWVSRLLVLLLVLAAQQRGVVESGAPAPRRRASVLHFIPHSLGGIPTCCQAPACIGKGRSHMQAAFSAPCFFPPFRTNRVRNTRQPRGGKGSQVPAHQGGWAR